MKKLYKILPIVLAVAMLITFASCKKEKPIEMVETVPTATDSTSTTAETATEPVTESTEPETETKKDAEKSTGTSTPKPTSKPTQKPTEKPTQSTSAPSIKPQGSELWGVWRTTETIDVSEMLEDAEVKNAFSGTKIKLSLSVVYSENRDYVESSKIQNPQEVQSGIENAIIKLSGITPDDPNYSEAAAEAKSEAQSIYADLESELNYSFNCTYKANEGSITYYYGFDPIAYSSYTVSGNTLTITTDGVTTKYTKA